LIYLDTSVALAHLLAENRQPPASLWNETIVSSSLLEYEIWTRINARGLEPSHGEAARQLVSRIALVEMVNPVLSRALLPYPLPVRTLDSLHLATMDFLQRRGQRLQLACYDDRLARAAVALGFPLANC
jgi:hypothetical protein